MYHYSLFVFFTPTLIKLPLITNIFPSVSDVLDDSGGNDFDDVDLKNDVEIKTSPPTKSTVNRNPVMKSGDDANIATTFSIPVLLETYMKIRVDYLNKKKRSGKKKELITLFRHFDYRNVRKCFLTTTRISIYYSDKINKFHIDNNFITLIFFMLT